MKPAMRHTMPVAGCRKCGGELENKSQIREARCRSCLREARRKYRALNPWYSHLHGIQYRCSSVSPKDYKYYGSRGIKCFLRMKDVKELWFRDKAHEMKAPSVDRINPQGHYEKNNCRFLELSENCRRARLKKEVPA